MERKAMAPIFKVAPREIFAVEHPLLIKNLDNGIKTFGTNRPFERVLDSDDPEASLPLYLRHNDPMCVPIMSHNSPTNNVLLQITVPKRTGRKRKRGSQDPYTDGSGNAAPLEDRSSPAAQPTNIRSQSRMDNPAQLLRALKDNVGKYKVDAVGQVNQTHRFRGLADFHQSTTHSSFMPKFQNNLLSGNIDKIKEFKFDYTAGGKLKDDLMPPPAFAAHSLPFNWAWHQNPHIFIEHNKNTGEMTLTNRSKAKNVNHNYIAQAAETVPHDPPPELPIKGNMLALVQELQIAMKERPIWTRRSLINRVSHLAGQNTALYNMRIALQYVGYQFRGGPWRDAVVKLGVDPRKDPKYRKYQTLTYKLFEEEEKIPGMPWSDVRQTYSIAARAEMAEAPMTHLFDGNTLTIDGKLWQLCDITDPLLVHLIENAPYRGTCDIESDGWYTNGALAKIKAIMKTKLLAIRANKELKDKDFETALSMPDIVEPQDKPSRLVHIPVPDIRLSDEEIEEMKKRGVINAIRGSGIRKRVTKTSLRVQRMGEKGSLKLKKRPVRKGPVRVPRKSAMTTAIYAAIEANPERQTSTDPGTTNEGDMESAIDPNLEDADEDVGGDLEDGDGESESEVEEDEHDEGGSGDEDLESDGGERIDGYDSDATDIVDFRTLYAPQKAT